VTDLFHARLFFLAALVLMVAAYFWVHAVRRGD
jgi:hypothetical protein